MIVVNIRKGTTIQDILYLTKDCVKRIFMNRVLLKNDSHRPLDRFD